MLSYGSVCSGIEAATVAWEPLGMRAAWYAEIEPFPCAVLAHHYPQTPNLGDMTTIARQVLAGLVDAPDVLVGGTPCQAFSVAGERQGLEDPRGALTIKYVELLDAIDHVRVQRGEPECTAVWENVPGVLSDKGNAFGCFLAALVGESEELQPPGGKWKDAGCVYGPRRSVAWRVLDAQYFGLAQRRRRVFLVAGAGNGFDPASVLFERDGVRRDTPPRRGQAQDLTGHAPFRLALQCGCGCTFDTHCGPWGCPNCEGDEGPAVNCIAGVPAFGGHSLSREVSQSATLTAKGGRQDLETETYLVAPTLAGGGRRHGGYSLDDIPMVAGTLQASGRAAGSATSQDAHAGLLVVHGTQDPNILTDIAHTLGRNTGQENAVFDPNQITSPTNRSKPSPGLSHTLPASSVPPVTYNCAATLEATAGRSRGAGTPIALLAPEAGEVRRLLPHECERLQGFPDDYTLIPWRGRLPEDCPDGPRYKAIGNSKAVYVVNWIGRRLLAQLGRGTLH